jgi:hypothetical protein
MKTLSFVYYEDPCAAVHWDDEDRVVRIEWKKSPDSASFRRALDAGIELITQKKGQRWLADCMKMGPVAVEDTRWANEDWTPRAITAGVKRLAFVVASRLSTLISVMGFVSGSGGERVPTMRFNDIDEARRWLREQR